MILHCLGGQALVEWFIGSVDEPDGVGIELIDLNSVHESSEKVLRSYLLVD